MDDLDGYFLGGMDRRSVLDQHWMFVKNVNNKVKRVML